MCIRDSVYIAQPPLYRVKRGKSERYIRDESDFAHELMKRATEDHTVKPKEGAALEGASLTKFLLNVQEFEAAGAKLSRRLRDPRLVELLVESGLEKKTDFEDKKALEKLLKEVDKAKLKLEGKVAFDEEHSLYEIQFGPPHGQKINWALASTAEYKRLRGLARVIDEFNKPPFVITNNEMCIRDSLQSFRRLARRWCFRCQRALRLAGVGNFARWRGVGTNLRKRQAHFEIEADR